MTGELKTLMDQATDRGTSFAPDVTELVAAGRHRIRRRRALLSAATAVGTATAVITVLLMGRIAGPRTDPQPATVAQPAAITDLCAKSDNFLGTANDDAWRQQVVATWTDKVVEATDADGTMTVRRSPDGSQYAYCVAGVPIQGQPSGGFGSVLLNVGIVKRQYQIQRYWSMGCGNEPVDRTYNQASCRGVRYSYAGRVPEGVTRIAFTGLGQRGDATVKDGYWVHRDYTVDIRNGNTDPVYITMYNDTGRQVFKERY